MVKILSKALTNKQCNAIQSNKVQEDKESGNKARAINLQVHHEERGKGRKKKEKKERKN
jgi:dsRNA-specific ribonuclease